jgi:hypothetical protein
MLAPREACCDAGHREPTATSKPRPFTTHLDVVLRLSAALRDRLVGVIAVEHFIEAGVATGYESRDGVERHSYGRALMLSRNRHVTAVTEPAAQRHPP